MKKKAELLLEFLDELREILLSTSIGEFYGPPGTRPELRQVPFLEEWSMRSLAFDPEAGRSRIVCELYAGGKNVMATIDARDFREMCAKRSHNYPNDSNYHDFPVYASILIQEQILTKSPDEFAPGQQVRICSPSDRDWDAGEPVPDLGEADGHPETDAVFPEGFTGKLREILLSTTTSLAPGPPGTPREMWGSFESPFLGEWSLRSLAFGSKAGRRRILCELYAGKKNVTAVIDARDFPELLADQRGNGAGGDAEHVDLAIRVALLVQGKILDKTPDKFRKGQRIRIRDTAGRAPQ